MRGSSIRATRCTAAAILLMASAPLASGQRPLRPHPPSGAPRPLLNAALTGLSRIERTHADAFARIHAARKRTRYAEKLEKDLPPEWQKTAALRADLTAKILAMLEKAGPELRGPVPKLRGVARREFARSGLRLLSRWLELSAPHEMRRAVATRLPGLRIALRWQDEEDARRRFLALVADRSSQTPLRTDLEDLCEMLAWTAMFHAEQKPGAPQLQAVTKDLIVVLTERGESGLRVAKLGYYRPGRFLDSGFAKRLRDRSDQVRHFIWALRAMAGSPHRPTTQQLLDLKELRDSAMRLAPIEKADLAMNRHAREVTEALLGVKKDLAANRRVPRPSADLPELVRKTLGH